MFKDPFGWFPSQTFSTVFAYLVIGTFAIDYLLVRSMGRGRSDTPLVRGDRWSYALINVTALVAIVVGAAFRWLGWGVAPGAVQYLGLALILLGLALREWAVYKLGRFFSRTVEIEAGHQLVTDGPYRLFRHPAYTGMLLVDLGFVLALGTWLGALVTLALVLAATLYRIAVEEKLLLATFGEDYRLYMQRTWRLFPGW